MKIQVQLLRQAAQREDTAAVRRVVEELDAGVRESYADVRELLMHFRTRTSEEDIEPALRATLQKFEHQAGLSTRLNMDGHGVPLAAGRAGAGAAHPAGGAVQRAQARRRAPCGAARAALAALALRGVGRRPGFDPADPARAETHVGLRIMQERAQRIGAHVRVRSAPGAGCTVVLELPPAAPDALAPPLAEATA